MIERFRLSVTGSLYMLFAFFVSTAVGLLIEGEVGDSLGRKYVIWVSILGSSPFAMQLTYCNLTWIIIFVILVVWWCHRSSSSMAQNSCLAMSAWPLVHSLVCPLAWVASALHLWLVGWYYEHLVCIPADGFSTFVRIVTYLLPNIKEKNWWRGASEKPDLQTWSRLWRSWMLRKRFYGSLGTCTNGKKVPVWDYHNGWYGEERRLCGWRWR